MHKTHTSFSFNLLLAISLILALTGSAQTHIQDSLKVYLMGKIADTSRTIALADLSFTYLGSKPDTSMLLALEGHKIANQLDFNKGIALNLNRIGNAYSIFGNYPKAMDAYLQGLKICEQMNYQYGQASILNNLARMHLTGDLDYRTSLFYLFQANSLFLNMQDTLGLLTSTLNICACYFEMEKYDSSGIFAMQSYNLAQKINNPKNFGGPLYFLGSINYKTGNYGIALAYCRESFPYMEYSKDYNNLSKSYLTTAQIFQALHQTDSVLVYAKKAFSVAKASGYFASIRTVADFLSNYYRNKNIDSAFYYQDLSKAIGDTLYGQEKLRALQQMTFDEKMRQQELANQKMLEEEDRKHHLQYIAIVVAIISFVILFFLFSRTIVVGPKFIKFFSILGLLAVFEFINLLIHPWLEHITHHSPIPMLGILMGIAALLIPLHHKLEHWITHKMIESNNKIRLAAAKKTLKELEQQSSNIHPTQQDT